MSLQELLADAPAPIESKREDADQAAERLGISADDANALRQSLGMHFEEITKVDLDGDDGPVVTTFDGAKLVFRGGSQKDTAGNAGWLLAERPDGRDANDPAAPVYDMPLLNGVGVRFGNLVDPVDPHDKRVKDGTKPGAPTGADVSAAVDAEHADKGDKPPAKDTNKPKLDTGASRPAKG